MQPDEGTAHQPEGAGQAEMGLQHGAEGHQQQASCTAQAGLRPTALGWAKMEPLGPRAGVGEGRSGDPSYNTYRYPQDPGA